MKKFISILLSFVLCLFSMNSAVYAEEKKSSMVFLGNVTGKIGEIINLPINIKDNQGIISLVTEILYDNTALKLKGIEKNVDFWESATMTPGGDLSAQPYRIIWYDGLAKNDFTEDGTLAELSFEILKAGSHEIKLSVSESDTFNFNFINIPFSVSNGVIDVSSETTTTTTSTIVTTTTTSEPITSITTTTTTKNETESCKLSLGSLTGTIGETLRVPISIKNNPGLISLLAEISYDDTALSIKEVEKNSNFWESATMTPGGDLNAQPYRIIWYDGLAKSDFAEDGILAYVSFEILKTGSHNIMLSVSESDTFDINFTNVAIDVIGGIINVSSQSSTTTKPTTSLTTTTTSKPTTTITTSPVVTTLNLGNVNYDDYINAYDASMILAEYAIIATNGTPSFTEEQMIIADVNEDDEVNALDASLVLAYYAHIATGGTSSIKDFITSKV